MTVFIAHIVGKARIIYSFVQMILSLEYDSETVTKKNFVVKDARSI